MAVESSQLEEQLARDKAVKKINNYLDQQEQIIALRGRDEDLMRGDYQNLLNYYLQLLNTVFLSTPIDAKEHSTYLQSLNGGGNEYFKSISACSLGLQELLTAIPSSAYQEVINEVKQTINSRIAYLSALQRALPIGRYSYPVDVAWFHRHNEVLIKHYLAEHENDILLRPEDAGVKKICDFKVLKLEVVNNLHALLPKSISNTFFTPGDDVRCEVANYLRYHLLEPVRALAENNNLVDPANYSKQLDELVKRFQSRLTSLKANNKEDSIALSEAAVKLVNVLNEGEILPFLSKTSESFQESAVVLEGLASLSL